VAQPAYKQAGMLRQTQKCLQISRPRGAQREFGASASNQIE
jgi:ribosomal protein S14